MIREGKSIEYEAGQFLSFNPFVISATFFSLSTHWSSFRSLVGSISVFVARYICLQVRDLLCSLFFLLCF